MRTNIEIDDKLMKQAMKVSGAATKKAVVEDALKMLVNSKAQEGMRKWFGKVEWDGPAEEGAGKDKWEESRERGARASRGVRKRAA